MSALQRRLKAIEDIWFNGRTDKDPVKLLLEFFQRAKLVSFKNNQQEEADLVVENGLDLLLRLIPTPSSEELVRIVNGYIKQNNSVTNSDNLVFGIQKKIDADFSQKMRDALLAKLLRKLKDETTGAHSFIRCWSRTMDTFDLLKYPQKMITEALLEDGLYSHTRRKVCKARKYEDLLAYWNISALAGVSLEDVAKEWAECGGIPAFKSGVLGVTVPITAFVYLNEITKSHNNNKFKRWDDDVAQTVLLVEHLKTLSENGLGVIGLRPEDFRAAALNRVLQFGRDDGYFNHIHAFTLVMLVRIFAGPEDKFWQNIALRIELRMRTIAEGWYRVEEDKLLEWVDRRIELLPKYK